MSNPIEGGKEYEDITWAFQGRHVPEEVTDELARARSKFKPFNSAHEGYAVILEELDELWDVVKLRHDSPERTAKMREEAIQVAAMAMRVIIDVCDRRKA